MFTKYYQNELTYLRDMGKLFAETNPALAGQLAEPGSNPGIERLLEGVAFLTARTRERAENCIPEIAQTLGELLTPQSLRSIPATTIVELQPEMETLHRRQRVPRGTPLGAKPIRDTTCIFRTTVDTELLPVILDDVVLDETAAAEPVLRLELSCARQDLPSVFAPSGIRLFIAEPYPVAATLFLWFCRYCVAVELNGRDNPEENRVAVPVENIEAVGFDATAGLFPDPRFTRQGVRLWQEYLTLPAKLLFLDITGLDAALAIDDERFAISFTFDRPPALDAPVSKKSIRLNCVPAVNLFKRPASPIHRSAVEQEHLLRAAKLDPAHVEVYDVLSVTGSREGGGDRVYKPFADFTHASPAGYNPSFYDLRRTTSPFDGGIDTYLSVVAPRDQEPDMGEEVLSIDLECTNRSLAGELEAGDISQPVAGSPPSVRFENITEVTAPVRSPLGTEAYWRVLAHLGSSHSSLATLEGLRSFLALHDLRSVTDPEAGSANRRRREAITAVETTPVRRLLEGTPVRGSHTRVELREDGFAGAGDAFLFGCVLDELFANRVSINSFHELSIELRGTEGEYRWLPRAGNKTIV